MSQYRGYYTSATQDTAPSPTPSIPFIVNSDDDFEYDRSYRTSNKRSYSEVEKDQNYNTGLDSGQNQAKSQKVNDDYSNMNTSNYYSSTSNFYSSYQSNSHSHTAGVSSSSRNLPHGPSTSYGNGSGTSVNMNHNKIQSGNGEHFPDQRSTFNKTNHTPVPDSPMITPELSMPVFQTVDRFNGWEEVKRKTVTARDDDITVRSEKSEQWAWGNGKKWVGASGPRPKLNVYSGAPKIDMFQSAARVSGGIGEKLLQKMGWKEGEGLGKTKEGDTEPIQFKEIKTDRKGLVSQEEDNFNFEVQKQEKTKSKFSEIKSTSFWNWHGTGMKGPENLKDRMKNCKKESKEKVPLDLSGKHPVSAIMELCSKKRWNEPKFISEMGPAGFKFKVGIFSNIKKGLTDTLSSRLR